MKFDKARIGFLITDETKELMQFWIIPAGSDNPSFKNSLIIEARDFDKLYNFFRPKPTTKKRKK
jgi:hypothetical protein